MSPTAQEKEITKTQYKTSRKKGPPRILSYINFGLIKIKI